jgi:hypothetical protein
MAGETEKNIPQVDLEDCKNTRFAQLERVEKFPQNQKLVK